MTKKKSRRKKPGRKRSGGPPKAKRPRIFLETSGVIYDRHGASLMKQAVQQAVANGRVEVSNFIRMEYIRGVVVNLIELYFLIKESKSVADALIDWSQKVGQERKLKIVLMSITAWLTDQTDPMNQEKSQRRLGDLVVRLVSEFDELYKRRSKDRLRCRLGKCRFPSRMFDEEMLLRFYERFQKIRKGTPDCQLCQFKDVQQVTLSRRKIDLHGPAQQSAYSKFDGYVQQADRLTKALKNPGTSPKCRWCEQLGDTIIALHLPASATLVTADHSFIAFCGILNRKMKKLPSLAQLKKQLPPQPPPTQSPPMAGS